MDGLLIIRKPAGMTSFATLGPIKRLLGISKIGHAGTLDKFAEGVLLVLSGTMTRLVPYFMDLDKEYIAVIEFGMETDTLDPEGEMVRRADIPSREIIEDKVRSFTGSLLQRPPAYSAVHIDGTRAYKLARKGDSITLSPKEVRIFEFAILKYEPPLLTVRVRCSKGTYIRSLARDLGEACGSCAFVKELVRTKIGNFSYDDSCPVGSLSMNAVLSPRKLFERLPSISVLHIDDAYVDDVLHGRSLNSSMFLNRPECDGIYAVFSVSETFLALVEHKDGMYIYKFTAGHSTR